MHRQRVTLLICFVVNLHAVVATSATSGSLFMGYRTRSYSNAGIISSRPGIRSSYTSKNACTHYAVVTTIFEPSTAVNATCARLPDWCLVVVADRKGPATYSVDGPCKLIHLSVHEQETFAATSDFVASLPWNHFGRKNVGYLYAILHGAATVWDFDDDNELLVPADKLMAGCVGPSTLKQRISRQRIKSRARADETSACTVVAPSSRRLTVVNPYPLLGATHFSWPRGFPLEQIKNGSTHISASQSKTVKVQSTDIGVFQSLADFNPDVDAIYRLTRPLPLDFIRGNANHLLVLPESVFAPFNAQATLFASSAVWALYLPVTVHGRVSDIWRSYIAQRLMWDVGLKLAFGGPWVRQVRNEHRDIADLESETFMYLRTEALLQFLGEWRSNAPTLAERVVELYTQLYEREYVEREDVDNIVLWLKELNIIGYVFPRV